MSIQIPLGPATNVPVTINFIQTWPILSMFKYQKKTQKCSVLFLTLICAILQSLFLKKVGFHLP